MSALEQTGVSILLPTYNEAENIGELLDDLERWVPPPFEVIVVDDNSPDGTWRIVEERAASAPYVRVIRRMTDPGLTAALNDGLDAARGAWVLWMDADLSMPASKIPEMIEASRRSAVVVGSRYVAGGGDARAVSVHLAVQMALSRILSWLGRGVLGCDFRDWSSGFILVRRELLEGYRLEGDYGEYFIALIHHLVRRRGARVQEIPYTLTPRSRGESKTATNVVGLGRRGVKYLATLARLAMWQPEKRTRTFGPVDAVPLSTSSTHKKPPTHGAPMRESSVGSSELRL